MNNLITPQLRSKPKIRNNYLIIFFTDFYIYKLKQLLDGDIYIFDSIFILTNTAK
jgi:hypothetical protein